MGEPQGVVQKDFFFGSKVDPSKQFPFQAQNVRLQSLNPRPMTVLEGPHYCLYVACADTYLNVRDVSVLVFPIKSNPYPLDMAKFSLYIAPLKPNSEPLQHPSHLLPAECFCYTADLAADFVEQSVKITSNHREVIFSLFGLSTSENLGSGSLCQGLLFTLETSTYAIVSTQSHNEILPFVVASRFNSEGNSLVFLETFSFPKSLVKNKLKNVPNEALENWKREMELNLNAIM